MHLKLILISLLSFLNFVVSLRFRRAAYDLPSGVQEQLGLPTIKKTFNCNGKINGYYSDVDNECKLFHICNDKRQSTMACGLKQRFDQSKLACNHEEDSIPCEASPEFFYLNERIGDERADFLGPADIEKAKNARPQYARAAAARARARAARRA